LKLFLSENLGPKRNLRLPKFDFLGFIVREIGFRPCSGNFLKPFLGKHTKSKKNAPAKRLFAFKI
jgi:hypothetical protein